MRGGGSNVSALLDDRDNERLTRRIRVEWPPLRPPRRIMNKNEIAKTREGERQKDPLIGDPLMKTRALNFTGVVPV